MSPARRLSESQPTLATVAERAGVSRQTVSNALNNPELLREDTLARVQAVIAELGYTPNRAARQLRTRTSRMIGLRIEAAQEGTSNAMMDRFVHTLVETTARTGHHIVLFSGDPADPLELAEELRAALSEAAGLAARLVATLRQGKREKKVLASVLTNLKQLNLGGTS